MSYAALILSHTPACYFKLDESAYPLADSTGHGYTSTDTFGCTLGGSPAFTGAGSSAQFGAPEKANDITVLATLSAWPLASLPHGGAPFSYEAWLAPIDDHLGASADGGGPLLSVWGSAFTVETRLLWSFDSDPQGSLILHNRGASGGPTAGVSALSADLRPAWHHVVGTWDGSVGALYLDGVPQTLQPPSNLAHFADAFSVYAAHIGAAHLGPPFTGNIAHAATYAYALSPCQVKQHHDEATTGTHGGCGKPCAQVQLLEGWRRTGVIHDGGTPESALVTAGGDPLTVPTITP